MDPLEKQLRESRSTALIYTVGNDYHRLDLNVASERFILQPAGGALIGADSMADLRREAKKQGIELPSTGWQEV